MGLLPIFWSLVSVMNIWNLLLLIKITQLKTKCILSYLKNNSEIPNFSFSYHDSSSGPHHFTGITTIPPWHPGFFKKMYSISKYSVYISPDEEQYEWLFQAPDHLSALLPFIFLPSSILNTPIIFITGINLSDIYFIRSLFIWYINLLSQTVEGLLNIYPRKCLGHSSWPVPSNLFSTTLSLTPHKYPEL